MVQADILVLCNREKLKKRVIYGAPDMIIEILLKSTWKKARLMIRENQLPGSDATKWDSLRISQIK